MRHRTSTITLALAALALGVGGCDPPDIHPGDVGADVSVDAGEDGGARVQCSETADCEFGQYCVTAACGDPMGVCLGRPDSCADVYLPVCGCDGTTYSNACGAASAGVGVAGDGECGSSCVPIECAPNSAGIDSDGDGCPDRCQEIELGFCQSNSGCGPAEFCAGACGGSGTCSPRPDDCFQLYAPVCGCDGETYGNACEANAAGVNVAAEGECVNVCPEILCAQGRLPVDTSGDGCSDSCVDATQSCVLSGQVADGTAAMPSCGEGEFCQAPAGSCGADGDLGVCVAVPQGCDDVYAPVCGCDGETYGNDCEALGAGVNKLSDGECDSCDVVIDCAVGFQPVDKDGDGCDDSCDIIGPECGLADVEACPQGYFCETFSCGTESSPTAGACVELPTTCNELYAPVCGCDGQTYGNDCKRQAAGVSGDHDGPCAIDCGLEPLCGPDQVPVDSDDDGCSDGCAALCSGDSPCPDGSYCDQPGCGDGPGLCAAIAQGCPDIWMPVCGCDGKTHANECEAAAMGVSVAVSGECASQPGDSCGGLAGASCAAGKYCEYPEALCGVFDLLGTCLDIPQTCTAEVDEVCGCDGKTYVNDCQRQLAQAHKAYDGACEGPCLVVIDCLPGYTPVDADDDGCDYTCEPVTNTCGGFVGGTCASGLVCDDFPGMCGWADAPGQCVAVSADCGDGTAGAPVCGCDGATYTSDCHRLQAGVGKDYDGACAVPCTPILCPDGQLPNDADGDGCDEECLPGASGCESVACLPGSVAIDTTGDGCHDQCVDGTACGGADGTASCADAEFCEQDVGLCDAQATGACMEKPLMCDFLLAQVCGCDGVTYANDCTRRAAGVAKLADGACGPDGGGTPGTP